MALPRIYLLHHDSGFQKHFTALLSQFDDLKPEISKTLSPAFIAKLIRSPFILLAEGNFVKAKSALSQLQTLCEDHSGLLIQLEPQKDNLLLQAGGSPHHFILALPDSTGLQAREFSFLISSLSQLHAQLPDYHQIINQHIDPARAQLILSGEIIWHCNNAARELLGVKKIINGKSLLKKVFPAELAGQLLNTGKKEKVEITVLRNRNKQALSAGIKRIAAPGKQFVLFTIEKPSAEFVETKKSNLAGLLKDFPEDIYVAGSSGPIVNQKTGEPLATGAVISGRDLQRLRSAIKAVLRDKKLKSVEFPSAADGLNTFYECKVFWRSESDCFCLLRDISEQHKQLHAALENEKRFRQTIQKSGLLFYEIDIHSGKCIWFGDIEEIAGYSEEEFNRLSLNQYFEIVHPVDRKNIQTRFFLAAKWENVSIVEYQLKTKSGVFIRVKDSAASDVAANEKQCRVFGFIRDITQEREEQLRVERSEERYRAFIAHSSEAISCFETIEPILVTTPIDKQIQIMLQDAYLSDCNIAYAGAYGYHSEEEVIGKKMREFVVDDDPANIEAIRNFIINGYRLDNLESTEVDREGNIKYFVNNLIGIVRNGMLERVWSVQRDITQSKMMHRALQFAERKYQDIFENSIEGIFLSTLEGKLIDINQAMAKMFGYDSRSEMLQLVNDISGKMYANPDLREKLLQQLFTAGKVERFEGQALKKNNEIFWIMGSAQLVYKDNELKAHIEGSIQDITERKLAENALRESEARFRLLTQLSPDGILVHSEGKILFLNSKMLEIGGATDEEQVIGRNIYDFIHPDSLEFINHRLKRMAESGDSLAAAEEKLYRLDGRIIYVEVTSSPLLINGKLAYQLVIREISQRKRSEHVKEAESLILNMITSNEPLQKILNEICLQNEKLFEHSRCLIFRIEKNKLEIANQSSMDEGQMAWVRASEQGDFFGIARTCAQTKFPIFVADLNKDDRWGYLSGDLPDSSFRACWALPIRNTLREIVGVMACYFEYEAAPTANDEGTIGIITNLAAIAIEKRTLEAEVEKLSSVARQTTNAVILTDRNFRITWVNAGFSRLTGYDLSDVQGGRLKDFLSGPMTGHDEDLHEVFDQKDQVRYRVYNYTKPGLGFWADTTVDYMYDQKKEHVGYIVIKNEVTDKVEQEIALKEAKEKAEEANRLKSSFLANMSHEIRTPMNGILGFADILREELLSIGSNDLYRFAETIHTSGKRLLNLLNDILDISRIEANKIELEFSVCSLNDAVTKVVTLLLPLARRKEIRLDVLIADKISILADENRLYQILNNVIGNAIKFTQKGGVDIDASLHQASNALVARVVVTDTGMGIDADFLPRIFEPFLQESSGFSRSHEGTGLGLAISKRLIEMMSGSIYIESEKGKGTKVIIDMPLAGLESEDGEEAASLHLNSVLLGKLKELQPRIVIVEDDATSRSYFERMLTGYGRIRQFTNGPEALEGLSALAKEKEYPSVILLDIGLPAPMNGVQLRGEILSRFPEFSDTPIIAQTAYAMKDEQEAFRKEGFHGVLVKPVSKNDLLNLLVYFLIK